MDTFFCPTGEGGTPGSITQKLCPEVAHRIEEDNDANKNKDSDDGRYDSNCNDPSRHFFAAAFLRLKNQQSVL